MPFIHKVLSDASPWDGIAGSCQMKIDLRLDNFQRIRHTEWDKNRLKDHGNRPAACE
jgi:hypothetical protein